MFNLCYIANRNNVQFSNMVKLPKAISGQCEGDIFPKKIAPGLEAVVEDLSLKYSGCFNK